MKKIRFNCWYCSSYIYDKQYRALSRFLSVTSLDNSLELTLFVLIKICNCLAILDILFFLKVLNSLNFVYCVCNIWCWIQQDRWVSFKSKLVKNNIKEDSKEKIIGVEGTYMRNKIKIKEEHNNHLFVRSFK